MDKSSKKTLPGLALAAAAGLGAFTQPAAACNDTPFIGAVCLVAFTFCPRGYAEANGQLLPISQNTALFSLLGATYGGDGQTTFALPDLRGRSPVHVGQGPGLSNITLGQQGGAETVTLNLNQIPAHSHNATTSVTANATLRGINSSGNADTPGGNVLAQDPRTDIYSTAAAAVDMGATAINASATAATSIDNAGGGQPHDNRPPFLGIRYCIALEGIFPSRP
ncbi:MAG: tail fiber protein [Pseudomonadota bacterium]|nr:tail fiber protein [Pseudomonadota bacterium]